MRTVDAEQVDVLIAGAGLSGIGAGCHLRLDSPERTFTIRRCWPISWCAGRTPPLTADYVCRLLNHMAAHGYRQCIPASDAPGVTRRPLLDLASAYAQRSIQELPSQGTERPWRMRQNCPLDMLDFRRSDLDDGVMQFSASRQPEPAAA